MKIAVVDDIEIQAEVLAEMIMRYPFEEDAEVKIYTSGADLLSRNTDNIDIIFMDIELKTKTGVNLGMDLAEELKYICPQALYIYVSSYDDYYRRLAGVNSFTFLKKPVNEASLYKAIDDAIRFMDSIFKKFYDIKVHGEVKCIDLVKVLYVSNSYRNVTFKTTSDEISFYSKKTIGEIYGEVSKIYPALKQIKNNTIVNYALATRFGVATVFTDGKEFTVSRKWKEVHKKYCSKR